MNPAVRREIAHQTLFQAEKKTLTAAMEMWAAMGITANVMVMAIALQCVHTQAIVMTITLAQLIHAILTPASVSIQGLMGQPATKMESRVSAREEIVRFPHAHLQMIVHKCRAQVQVVIPIHAHIQS